MKKLHYFIVTTAIILSAAVSHSAEPDTDKLMGTVTLGSKLKPDSRDRRGIAAIAAKIMKIKQAGVVRIRGDFPAAENAEDYFLKSFFMAKEIEQQLKPLLKKRFQVFVMAAKFSGEKKTDPNIVDIFFYPRELKVVEMESLSHKSVQQKELPKEMEVPVSSVQKAVQPEIETVGQNPERAEADNQVKDSKKMKNSQDSEDPAYANELVARAKARAAERAKREAIESASPQ